MLLWINAREIPYRGFRLYPERTFSLSPQSPTLREIQSLFVELEKKVKEGFYALGFFSYELGYLLEKRLSQLYRPPSLPLIFFYLGKSWEEILLSPEDWPFAPQGGYRVLDPKFNLSRQSYVEALTKIKDYIASGETYQVNFTGKLKFKLVGSPLELFKSLLFSQRCEYACYLENQDFVILSLSPELFLKKTGLMLVSSPMKGTLGREFLFPWDERKKSFLQEDPKSRAENLMILDLLRNDLGRVSRFGSVKVDEYLKIETYPTLHQMISTVSGSLNEAELFAIFKALFPCGSVTGAPKIRTMEILRELESEPRGVYTGAVGYLTPDGDFLFNVAIRTISLEKRDAFYQGELGLGSGILWDSLPEVEFEETLLKGKFLKEPLPYFCLLETFSFPCEMELLRLHYQRLTESVKYFQFCFRRELESFSEFLRFIKERAPSGRSKLRLIYHPTGKVELEVLPSEGWKRGLQVAFRLRKTPPFLFHFHKTTQREEYNRARAWAVENQFDEVVFFNERGEILEGTISNFFAEKDGVLYTPPIVLGLLPGVFRKRLLQEGKANERVIKLSELKDHDNLYLGNSARNLGKIQKWSIFYEPL